MMVRRINYSGSHAPAWEQLATLWRRVTELRRSAPDRVT